MEMAATEHPALLVMDMQRGISERYGGDMSVLSRTAEAAAAARSAGIPVIYAIVQFRDGAPEMTPRNKIFSAARRSMTGADPAMMEIHPLVAPQPGDIVVVKKRVSAFAGSDLDIVLRAQGIDRLVMCGIATSGVVLSTLRYAADLDFGLTVLSDCCLDFDPEVHQTLIEKVFPHQADVMTSAEWRAAIAGG